MVDKTRRRLAAAQADIARISGRLDALPGGGLSRRGPTAAATRPWRSASARSRRRSSPAVPSTRSTRPWTGSARSRTLLGDPQRAYPVIHVTGTNGKTSTARMIETLLRARGLRTGLFTSPHLTDISERISIDGEPLPRSAFWPAYDEIGPTWPWWTSASRCGCRSSRCSPAMAFAAFADAPVDVAVVEVGMGGTWDATNIADGAVAVVTPISIDHTRYLGSTVEEIAAEKAGIIKPGAVAVLAQQPVAAAEVLLRRAAEVGATVAREGLEFGVLRARAGRRRAAADAARAARRLRATCSCRCSARTRRSNAACALAAVEAFARRRTPGGEPLGEDLVREAFATVTSPGRLEVVRRSPVVIVDAAHNPAGMAAAWRR